MYRLHHGEHVCPQDVTVPADADCEGIVPDLTGDVIASSNCTPSDALLFSQSPSAGTAVEPGVVPVTLTVTDLLGNSESCETLVTVADSQAPVITCPEDITVQCSPLSGQIVNFMATATDICESLPAVTCVPPSGSLFLLGTTEVTCTSTDASGNSSVCMFNVTVEGVGVEIPEPSILETTEVARFDANVVGVDADEVTYSWDLLNGACTFVGDTNQEFVQMSPNFAEVDCTVRVTANFGECGLFTDEQSVSFKQTGGGQLPSDCNQDGELDLSDGICLLSHLFLANPSVFPCEAGALDSIGNKHLLDMNDDDSVDLSDAIGYFNFLFLGGVAPVLGAECVPIFGCPENCTPGA